MTFNIKIKILERIKELRTITTRKRQRQVKGLAREIQRVSETYE